MNPSDELPEFLLQAAEGDDEMAADTDLLQSGTEVLPRVLPAEPPSASVLGRLMAEVEVLPLRYAPFFAQLTTIYHLSEAQLCEQLERARDEAAWRAAGLPGVRLFDITPGASLKASETVLVRFDPGTKFPKHRHQGRETTMVLEGDYEDTNGVHVGAGQIQIKEPDTEHGLRISTREPCIAAAVIEEGFEFTSWPLRAWAKLVRR